MLVVMSVAVWWNARSCSCLLILLDEECLVVKSLPLYPTTKFVNPKNRKSKRWTVETAVAWFDANGWPGVGLTGERGVEFGRVVNDQNVANPGGLD